MIGILKTKNGTYIFRDDHGFEPGIWAWNIHDELGISDHIIVHKWDQLPKGEVILFDIESPPNTIPYLPILV